MAMDAGLVSEVRLSIDGPLQSHASLKCLKQIERLWATGMDTVTTRTRVSGFVGNPVVV
jgi:hypothetical protein